MSYSKNQKVVDVNKLTAILLKGEVSYVDGRYDYWYENLLKVLGEAGVDVNQHFLHEEARRRWEVRRSKVRCNKAPKRRRFLVTLASDSVSHFHAVYRSDVVTLPEQALTHNPEWDYESEPRNYGYTAPDGVTAARLLRYIKSVHPGYINLKVKLVD
jgi:hypothetical protein